MSNSFNLSNMYSSNARQSGGPYGDGNRYTEDVYDPTQNRITQTKQQFLDKYKDAIGPDGRFIPGKANLYFDNMDAGNVYQSIIGSQNGLGRGAFAPERRGQSPVFNSEVNADWIEDNRPGGGWASVKDGVLPIAATIGAMYGGSMLLGEGLGAGLGAEAGYGVMPELGTTIPQAGAAIGSSSYAPIAAEGLGSIVGAGAAGTMPALGISIPTAGAPITSLGASSSVVPQTLAGITEAGGGMLGAGEAAALTDSIGAQAAIPTQIGTGATAAANAAGAPMAQAAGLNGVTGSITGNALNGGGFLSGLSNINNIARAGSSLYSAIKGKEGADATTNALQEQMKTLNDMYKEGSPWANQLKEQLARKDAAAGRNSQYGARLAQYQAMLADKAGQNAGVLGQLATQAGSANSASNGYLNLLLNRGGDVANALGLTDALKPKAEDAIKGAWDYFFGG